LLLDAGLPDLMQTLRSIAALVMGFHHCHAEYLLCCSLYAGEREMQTITLNHEYTTDPQTLWLIVTDYAALAEVMEGIVHFEGLPAGRTQTG
jgi:hypothetical protein